MRKTTVCLLAALALPLFADEGMWLYNNPPLAQLKSKYGFEPSQAWLDHLQRSSVRFNNGGSGSFVSPDGLVMTNHHVASDCIAKLSTQQNDLIKNGFLARSKAEERGCNDLELNVLMSIEDVTRRVNGAVAPGMDVAASKRARTAAINAIEKESLGKTGLRSDVVTLYNGGHYHLYRYKRYTDVRLVFAPELAAAFFGGDPDNFEYPRYNIDVSFLRVYENNQPVQVKDYLRWSASGAHDNELVFVSGHPGRTDRLDTVRHLESLRDVQNPFVLNVLRRREVLLKSWAERSSENARRAQDDLFYIQNSRKARTGMLAGLQDPAIMDRKRAEENNLREAVNRSPELKKKYGDAWDQVAASVDELDRMYKEHYLLERGYGFSGRLFAIARDLVRYGEESGKPNSERLREYSESAIEPLKLELFSDAPIYENLETVKLADSLALVAEVMGPDSPVVKQILAGKSPRERAAELVRGTSLKDVAVRRKLFDGGAEAVAASEDAMVQFAKLVDGPARAVRAKFEHRVEETQQQAYAKIAQARFAVYGSSVYPDATFTLRFAYGEVKGYEEDGRRIPWSTTIGGTFAHAADHGYKEPFNLPKSWLEKKDALNPNTPFNFVSTADIIGGNSGSPTVNKNGEVVGIIFDGNIQGLVLDYIYTDRQARALSVHSAAILEVLRKVYGATDLARELVGQS